MKLILVSNDDGIHSKGIRLLVRSLKKIRGARVVVVAPDRQNSAVSHAVTLHRPLRIQKITRDFYAIDGTPTDSVMLAVHKILGKKPDLVISGINHGANLGEDVHYSGTVSAAVEGAIMGIPAIAVSEVGGRKYRFDAASLFARKLARKVLKEGLPYGIVLNVNVPSLPPRQIKGYAVTFLGKHNYGEVLFEYKDPRGKPYFWIGGDPYQYEDRPGSDCAAFMEGKIAITPIKVDMTDRHFMNEIKKWKL